jgi:hypothetical protein
MRNDKPIPRPPAADGRKGKKGGASQDYARLRPEFSGGSNFYFLVDFWAKSGSLASSLLFTMGHLMDIKARVSYVAKSISLPYLGPVNFLVNGPQN